LVIPLCVSIQAIRRTTGHFSLKSLIFGKNFFMTAIDLKNELHEMINGLHDEDVLECVHKVVRTFQMKNSAKEYIDPVDELNEAQQAELEEAIEQSKNGQMTSHEDFKKEFAEWFTK